MGSENATLSEPANGVPPPKAVGLLITHSEPELGGKDDPALLLEGVMYVDHEEIGVL